MSRGGSKEKAIIEAAVPKPPLVIPPHSKLWCFLGFSRELDTGGFTSLADPRIMPWKYAKLLMNMRNALQAICGFDAPYADIAKVLREEALACFYKAEFEFASDDEMSERSRYKFQRGEIDGSPRPGSSTWQSLTRGRKSVETDYLNGEFVLLGALHGVPTPYNRAVQLMANRIASEGIPPGSMKLHDLENHK